MESISAIHSMLGHETAQWIVRKIDDLEGRSKFCAYNAIRFLRWADDIFDTSPIVASFCAMHATEEAVASFISAAKAHGHSEDAKKVNLRDHLSKALVSILAQRVANLAGQGGLGFSVHWDGEHLAYRIPKGDEFHYGDLHLSIFRLGKQAEHVVDGHTPLGDLPQLDDLMKEVEKGANARNKIIYATDMGVPTGFIEPGTSLIRETQLSLGLIWAAVDLNRNSHQKAPFIEILLKQMASFDKNRGKKKTCTE